MRSKKHPWLKQRLPAGTAHETLQILLDGRQVNTVCREAQCPNLWECFSRKTAVFMIMGPRCTRGCGFCAVSSGPIGPPDPDEPDRVAETARQLRLEYVVVTSVTRDDLSDGGAAFFAQTIAAIRKSMPGVPIEVLVPDFQGNKDALGIVAGSRPDVLNHNLETVPRLYDTVRPGAVYRRSLDLLKQGRRLEPGIITKSGLMLGLGETAKEIRDALSDLAATGVSLLTLGQYLQPSGAHLPVVRYVPPAEFDTWRKTALEMGFSEVASGPFVRSSYHAHRLYRARSV